MKRKRVSLIGLLIAISLFFIVSVVSGEEYESMTGIKMARTVFDDRIGDPKNAVLHLNVIRQTYEELTAMTKNPVLVIVFSGSSVKLLSKNREGFSPEERKSLDEIANIISAMSKDGIKLEICLLAAKLYHIDSASILPEIKKVGNGWISIIGYEAQGYSLVPVY